MQDILCTPWGGIGIYSPPAPPPPPLPGRAWSEGVRSLYDGWEGGVRSHLKSDGGYGLYIGRRCCRPRSSYWHVIISASVGK